MTVSSLSIPNQQIRGCPLKKKSNIPLPALTIYLVTKFLVTNSSLAIFLNSPREFEEKYHL